MFYESDMGAFVPALGRTTESGNVKGQWRLQVHGRGRMFLKVMAAVAEDKFIFGPSPTPTRPGGGGTATTRRKEPY